MIGYKIAQNDYKRVLVTLEIPNDARTNIDRDYIVNKEYASYRCDRAKVIDIEDISGNKYTMAKTAFYKNKSLTYKLGETIIEANYDNNINEIYTGGIHFFLDKEQALLYGLYKLDNGDFKEWYPNGQIRTQQTYKDGVLNGPCNYWFDNGLAELTSYYIEGQLNSEYKRWFCKGQLLEHKTYKNGIVVK